MKVLRFKCGKPEWVIPLDEIAGDMNRMLRIQWKEFIHELDDVERGSIVASINPAIIAMFERLFATAGEPLR
jgi:hypothetical protein